MPKLSPATSARLLLWGLLLLNMLLLVGCRSGAANFFDIN